jgi:hypothetical protein
MCIKEAEKMVMNVFKLVIWDDVSLVDFRVKKSGSMCMVVPPDLGFRRMDQGTACRIGNCCGN